MKNISSFYEIMAAIIITVGIIYAYRQRRLMRAYSLELSSTVQEAKTVCDDLEEMMEDALNISKIIVEDINGKIIEMSNLNLPAPLELEHAIDGTSCNKDECIPAQEILDSKTQDLPNKIRIYHLAQELGIGSNRLVNMVQSLGIDVVNHMNCLNNTQVLMVMKAIHDAVPVDINKTFEVVIERELTAQQDLVQINNSRLKTDSDKARMTIARPLPNKNVNLIFSIEDLKKAHPYLAVRTLRERGYSIRDIAQMLERGQGEVSLILNLSRKKQACL